jgi:hypothetical protein
LTEKFLFFFASAIGLLAAFFNISSCHSLQAEKKFDRCSGLDSSPDERFQFCGIYYSLFLINDSQSIGRIVRIFARPNLNTSVSP